VLLDDGFQQRRLRKDVEIVCLDARAPWGRGGLFPRGTLREPASALARAHLVVLTGSGGDPDPGGLRSEVRRRIGPVPCLPADYAVDGLEELQSGARRPGTDLRGRAVLAFAGIAAPERLAETLAAHGALVREVIAFPDHHRYEARDLEAVVARGRAVGAQLLVTTEKDAVRLPSRGHPPAEIGSPAAWPRDAGLPVCALLVRLVPVDEADDWRAALCARIDAAASLGRTEGAR
jgi:tetraacyldisaccharide 4'-kinase